MTKFMRLIGVAKGFSIAFGLSLALAGAARAEPLVVGYSSVTSVFLPFWIGKEAGFYKKENLDTQLVYIASSTTMAQAMFARQVAISTVNSGSVVTSGLGGGDLVLAGAVINSAAFYIISRPDIAGVQDLRGKTVGVTRLGSSSDFAMREYLQKHKLQAGRDVNILQVGGMPELAAALNNGVISAAPLSSPASHLAQQKGNRVIANLADEGIYFVIAGLTTTRRFLRAQRRRQSISPRLRPRDSLHVSTRRRSKKDSGQIRQDRRSGDARGQLALRSGFHRKNSSGEARGSAGRA